MGSGQGPSDRDVDGGGDRASEQSGSMGEGWSDWYALNHLYTAGLATTAVVGQHVTGNTSRGIRNWDYDKNPTTFGDIGYDVTGPEVHADGEHRASEDRGNELGNMRAAAPDGELADDEGVDAREEQVVAKDRRRVRESGQVGEGARVGRPAHIQAAGGLRDETA